MNLAAAWTFLVDVKEEYKRVAKEHGPAYHSPHEGYGEILEELDELWDEVRRKPKNRDPRAMYAECVQIAARATKFAISLGKRPKDQ